MFHYLWLFKITVSCILCCITIYRGCSHCQDIPPGLPAYTTPSTSEDSAVDTSTEGSLLLYCGCARMVCVCIYLVENYRAWVYTCVVLSSFLLLSFVFQFLNFVLLIWPLLTLPYLHDMTFVNDEFHLPSLTPSIYLV